MANPAPGVQNYSIVGANMILPDGSDFPGDYLCATRPDAHGVAYKRNWSDDAEKPRRMVSVQTSIGPSRLVYQHDDHPVVRAYHVLSTMADLGLAEHRKMYLDFIAIAVPLDDYGVISGERAAKITTSIQERNRMEDLEALLRRLDAAEGALDSLRGEINDDARAQGDAAARASDGILTCEIGR